MPISKSIAMERIISTFVSRCLGQSLLSWCWFSNLVFDCWFWFSLDKKHLKYTYIWYIKIVYIYLSTNISWPSSHIHVIPSPYGEHSWTMALYSSSWPPHISTHRMQLDLFSADLTRGPNVSLDTLMDLYSNVICHLWAITGRHVYTCV